MPVKSRIFLQDRQLAEVLLKPFAIGLTYRNAGLSENNVATFQDTDALFAHYIRTVHPYKIPFGKNLFQTFHAAKAEDGLGFVVAIDFDVITQPLYVIDMIQFQPHDAIFGLDIDKPCLF